MKVWGLRYPKTGPRYEPWAKLSNCVAMSLDMPPLTSQFSFDVWCLETMSPMSRDKTTCLKTLDLFYPNLGSMFCVSRQMPQCLETNHPMSRDKHVMSRDTNLEVHQIVKCF